MLEFIIGRDGGGGRRRLGVYFGNNSGGVVGLTSFNGRTTPAAVPTTGDYDYAQIAGPVVLPNQAVPSGAATISNTTGFAYPSTLTAPSTWALPASSAFTLLILADTENLVTSTNTISVSPNGTDTINGSNATKVALSSAGMIAVLTSDGVGHISMGLMAPGGNLTSYVSYVGPQANVKIPVPPWSKFGRGKLQGSGGGGGGGASAATAGGGGGGAQGSCAPFEFALSNLGNPTALWLTLGANGTGGNGATANGGSGSPGIAGTISQLGLATGPTNVIMQSSAANGGGAGTAAAGGTGGTANSAGFNYFGPALGGAPGGAGGISAAGASAANNTNLWSSMGGAGGGGGPNVAGTGFAGGTGGGAGGQATYQGTAGTIANNGGTPTAFTSLFGGTVSTSISGGGGGGGGGAGTGQTPGAGGTGGSYGGGGGGGGGAPITAAGGKGGDGAPAFFEIYFT